MNEKPSKAVWIFIVAYFGIMWIFREGPPPHFRTEQERIDYYNERRADMQQR